MCMVGAARGALLAGGAIAMAGLGTDALDDGKAKAAIGTPTVQAKARRAQNVGARVQKEIINRERGTAHIAGQARRAPRKGLVALHQCLVHMALAAEHA